MPFPKFDMRHGAPIKGPIGELWWEGVRTLCSLVDRKTSAQRACALGAASEGRPEVECRLMGDVGGLMQRVGPEVGP